MGRGRLPRVCPKPAHGVKIKDDSPVNLMREVEATVANGVFQDVLIVEFPESSKLECALFAARKAAAEGG